MVKPTAGGFSARNLIRRRHGARSQRHRIHDQPEAVYGAVARVQGEAREVEPVGVRRDDARVLAEGRREAELCDERAYRPVPFAIGVCEERGSHAELLLEPALRMQQVGPVRVRVGLPHVSVRRAVVADGDPCRDQLAQLVPAHDAGVAFVDRVGGDEHGERHAGLLQPGPRLDEGGPRRVVDGDADGALRQRPAGVDGGEDLGHRQHGVAAARQVLDVRFELGERDAGRRVLVLAEAVIHHEDGGIGGDCCSAAGRDDDGRGERDVGGAAGEEKRAGSSCGHQPRARRAVPQQGIAARREHLIVPPFVEIVVPAGRCHEAQQQHPVALGPPGAARRCRGRRWASDRRSRCPCRAGCRSRDPPGSGRPRRRVSAASRAAGRRGRWGLGTDARAPTAPPPGDSRRR